MNSRIEPARTTDFLAIAALDRIAWGDPDETFIPDGEHAWRVWCEYATVLAARGSAQDLSSESGNLVGALVMFPTTDRECFLHKIMVDPPSRGRGIGTQLMESALRLSGAPVLLTVDPENRQAIKLYEKFGFAVREHVAGYYRDHEDRLVMVYEPGKG